MRIKNLAGLAVAAFFVISCNSSRVVSQDVALFEETLRQTPNPQLVDVRTLEEYAEECLPGAINIDVKAENFGSLIAQLDKSRPVFVYCRLGKRSMQAASVLKKNHFDVVYNLDGGINAWSAQGKPVTKP